VEGRSVDLSEFVDDDSFFGSSDVSPLMDSSDAFNIECEREPPLKLVAAVVVNAELKLRANTDDAVKALVVVVLEVQDDAIARTIDDALEKLRKRWILM